MAPGGAAAAASKYEDAAAVEGDEEEIGVGFAGDCAKTEEREREGTAGKKSRGEKIFIILSGWVFEGSGLC